MPDTFWNASIAEAGLAVLGRHEKNERDHTITMEAARLISFFSIQPWTKKGQLNKPQDLWLLPHEVGLFHSKEKADEVIARVSKFRELFDRLNKIPVGHAAKMEKDQSIGIISPNVNA